jgi:hypothetical protein
MRLRHGNQATGPTGDGSVIVRKGGSGCLLVRGQGCKLTGCTNVINGKSFLPDVADPRA